MTINYLSVIVFGVIVGLVPAFIASSKGRKFLPWWFYGTFLFLIALIHSLLLSEDQSVKDERALASGGSMKCPFCAEVIKNEAIVCRHCGRDIPEGSASERIKADQANNPAKYKGQVINDGKDWVCLCGTANPYDRDQERQPCSNCTTQRDSVLEIGAKF
jgi:hypothetical protein